MSKSQTFLLLLQMRSLEGGFQEGDVILTNHPAAGGSHLPDLTVITPVFYK
jgi:5-oxoprolinase (ATP-hydrolysing)